jgi:hypothetical protein
MKELGRFFRIYCHQKHKQWTSLIPNIEKWINTTVSSTTAYAPVEIIFGQPRPNIFKELIRNPPNKQYPPDSLEAKTLQAYARLKLRAEARRRKRKRGNANWDPMMQDMVLVKANPVSNADKGLISKFQLPFEGPYIISQIISASRYELSHQDGRIRGVYNKRSLRPYQQETH